VRSDTWFCPQDDFQFKTDILPETVPVISGTLCRNELGSFNRITCLHFRAGGLPSTGEVFQNPEFAESCITLDKVLSSENEKPLSEKGLILVKY
jgi:hypothetical protein